MDLKVGQYLISKKTSPYRTAGKAYEIKTVNSVSITIENNTGRVGRFTFKEVLVYFTIQSHELWI